MKKFALVALATALVAVPVASANGAPQDVPPQAQAHVPEWVERGDMAVKTPPRGRTVVLEVIRDSGAIDVLTVSHRSDGTVDAELDEAGHQDQTNDELVASSTTPIAPCTDTAYVLASWRASPPPYFYINYDVMAPGVTSTMLRNAVVNGANNIVTARNDCGMPDYVDASNIVSPGTTTMRSGFYRRADGNHDCTFDNYSIIEMGYLKGALGSACHYLDVDGSMISFDIRFDKDRKWFTAATAPADCHKDTNPYYDLEGTATHEMGHLYGMGHAAPAGSTDAQIASHTLLTMHNFFRHGQICKTEYRTLGRGDVLGLEQKY